MSRKRFAVPLLSILVGALGCTSEQGGNGSRGIVRANAVASDLTIAPIHDADGNRVVLTGIRGFYGTTCSMHTGQPWWLVLNDPTDAIEVALGDTVDNCPLTVTSFVGNLGETTYFFPLAPPIAMGMSFTTAPSQVVFEQTPAALAFYANGKLSGLATTTYDAPFTMSLIYSDDAQLCKQKAPPAVYGTTTASADGATVPPPDYVMTFDGLRLVVDVHKEVLDRSSGNVTLTPGSRPGEEWKIFRFATRCCDGLTFAGIDWLYNGLEPLARGSIEGGSVVMPWTDFGLLGRRLPTTRTVIVKHLGAGGIYSYQLFDVAFPAPAIVGAE